MRSGIRARHDHALRTRTRPPAADRGRRGRRPTRARRRSARSRPRPAKPWSSADRGRWRASAARGPSRSGTPRCAGGRGPRTAGPAASPRTRARPRRPTPPACPAAASSVVRYEPRAGSPNSRPGSAGGLARTRRDPAGARVHARPRHRGGVEVVAFVPAVERGGFARRAGSMYATTAEPIVTGSVTSERFPLARRASPRTRAVLLPGPGVPTSRRAPPRRRGRRR